MKKDKLINFGLIFILGAIGGILGSQLFFPWLAGIAFLQNVDWIREAGEGTTVINRTERVVIAENTALEEAIDKNSNIVVGIISAITEKTIAGKKVILAKPEIIAQGTGFIASSDGLVLTAANLIPDSAQKVLVVRGGAQSEAEIIKKDKTMGIALLKIKENNLPVLPLAAQLPRLGEELYFIGLKSPDFAKFIDTSFVRQISPDLVLDFSGQEISGSPIFNIRGEIVGLNYVESAGQSRVIPSSAIKELLK